MTGRKSINDTQAIPRQ